MKLLKYLKNLILIIFIWMSFWETTYSQETVMQSNILIDAWKKLSKLDRFELLTSVHRKIPKNQQENPGIRTIEDSEYRYIQDGNSWRLDAKKSFNDGLINPISFIYDGTKYKEFFGNKGLLIITHSDRGRRLSQRWNSLLEPYSFLLEQQGYSEEKDEEYNRTVPKAPLFCDLKEVMEQADFLTRIFSSFKFEKGNKDSSIIINTWRLDDKGSKIPLSIFNLVYDHPNDVFPSSMKKTDPSGKLAIFYQVKEFKEFNGMEFPSYTISESYINGRQEGSLVTKIVKIRNLIANETIPDFDPSKAAKISDQINSITIDPSEFRE